MKAAVHWNSGQDAEWGFKLLAGNFEEINQEYLLGNIETKKEEEELNLWLEQLRRDID